MKKFAAISFLLIMAGTGGNLRAQDSTAFDRTSFYQSMASAKLKEVQGELNRVKQTRVAEKDAFVGALTMKMAGLVKGADKKLSLFKSGHIQLEGAIKKQGYNAEFRFLRLMIQENAPGILGYKSNLTEDKQFVVAHYDTLPKETQQAVVNYSKNSKILKPADL